MMSYRSQPEDLGTAIEDIERRLRKLEQPGAIPPDANWVLREVDNTLRYLYVPSGALGPAIGTK